MNCGIGVSNFFSKEKLILLYLPAVLTIGSLLLLVCRVDFYFLGTDDFKIISNISLFNQTHVLITFFLFLNIQHFKDWRNQFSAYGLSFSVYSLIIFSLIYVAVYVLLSDYFSIGIEKSHLLYFYLYQIAGNKHFLFQSFGFSTYLNVGATLQNNLSSDSATALQNQTLVEKKNLKYIYASYVLVVTAVTFLHAYQNFYKILISVGLLLGAFGLFQIFKSVRKIKSLELKKMKFIFCLRYILYPVKAFSPLMNLIAQVVHVFEYIHYSDRSLKEEARSNRLSVKQIVFFLSLQILFIIPLIIMNSSQLKQILHIRNIHWFVFASSFVNAIILSHFYFDGIAFSRKTNPTSFANKNFDAYSMKLYKLFGSRTQ